ncbi:MAG: polysaccharide biosynthesis tyrosine autokinase [Phycisphaerae bacterium]
MADSKNRGRAVNPDEPGAAEFPLADLMTDADLPAAGGRRTPHTRGVAFALLWRCKWTVLLVVLVVAGAANAYVWTQMTPGYRATATIRVSPVIPRLVFETEENGMIPLYASYVNTQVSIMASPAVLERALRNPEVQKTAWYRGIGIPNIEQLEAILAIGQRRRSELIDVSATTRRAKDAKVIADAIVNEYLYYVQNAAHDDEQKLAKTLNEQYESLAEEIRALEATTSTLRQNLRTGSPEQLMTARIQSLYGMEDRYRSLQREIEMTKRRLELVTSWQTQGPSATTQESLPVDLNPYAHDPEWRQRDAAVQTARHRVAVEGQHLGGDHPRLKQLQMEVDLATQLLRTREAQLDAAPTAGAEPAPTVAAAELSPAALKRRVEMLQAESRILEDDLHRETETFQKDFGFAEMLTSKNNDLQYKRELYQAVRERKEQKEMERQVPGSIRILAYATTPTAPYADRRMLFAALSGFLGLALGVGLAYVRSTLSPSVLLIDDFRTVSNAPLLGEVPLAGRAKLNVIQDDPLRVESIRMVRTALLRIMERNGSGVFCVTSAGPKAGKTTVAIMLARSLAKCGKHVLLVDADLRRPSVAQRLGIVGEPGLLGALREKRDDRETIVRDVLPNLSVLPAAPPNENVGVDTEMLANGVFRSGLERWREQFDVILVDTPPVMPVADTRIIARQVDGTILVVREGHCRRADVYATVSAIEVAGGRLIGTVFIGSAGPSGYRYSYGGYGYLGGDAKTLDVHVAAGSSA